MSDVSSPLNEKSRPETFWTTVNIAEAIPGVLTPLGWSFFGGGLELAMRGAFADLGVLKRRERVQPDETSERFTGCFLGRVAVNVDMMRRIVGDRLPGTSGDALELQLLGASRPDVESHATRRRYGVVALRLPMNAIRLSRQLVTLRRETERWWRSIVFGEVSTGAAARRLLREAFDRFATIMRLHSFASIICQAAYDQVAQLADRAGVPGNETALVGGYGGLEEVEVSQSLWLVARGMMTIDEFVEHHGYHGPDEGQISSTSWRMDHDPIHRAVERYQRMPDEREPQRIERQRVAERRRREEELLNRLGPLERLQARAVLRAAKKFVPLREVGKAAFLQAIDVGRFASRAIGEDLVAAGILRQTDDVYMLTLAEATAKPASRATALAKERRTERDGYLSLRVPQTWHGQPEPLPDEDAKDARPERLTGVAASAGVYEGRARIVTNPAEAEVDDGSVIVCHTTDPSWTILFASAGALIIDIGGPISHGAIMAREMGLPCVINTQEGTAVIQDGDLVRVDGSAGEVRILEPADASGADAAQATSS